MTPQPAPDPSADPTLAVAELQLVLLAELTQIVMSAARAYGASSVAASQAETMILGEEWFTPEVGRARACGAKDAAESLQKVARAARLTMKLQMVVAETVRDIRAGIVTRSAVAYCNAEETSVPKAGTGSGAPATTPRDGACPADRDSDVCRLETNTERLVEFDRAETLPRAALVREIAEPICADLGVTVDWKAWKLRSPAPQPEAVRPPAPDRPRPPPPGIDLSP